MDEICDNERWVRRGRVCNWSKVSTEDGLQIVKAIIAEAREQSGKEDINRCCKGGDSGRRQYRFGGFSASRSLPARECGPSRDLVQR